MAASQNAQLNKFTEDYYRPLADEFEKFLRRCQNFQAAYAAQSISSAAVADSANTIGQNQGDGRQLLTGLNLTNFKAAIDQTVTAMATTLVSGVGTTAKAQADLAQVNGLTYVVQ